MSKSTSQPTTAQSLGALLKSARDIMRKDKGLNGDLDRLPMLTWIMFLKFLDDLELQREGEAKLTTKEGLTKGILMPQEGDAIVIKLDNGYNIGIDKNRYL